MLRIFSRRPVPASARRARGTVTAELAIILPMILLLALGALEMGRLFQAWVITSNAAREGARHAALGVSASQVRSDVVLPYLAESGLSGSAGVQLPAAGDIQVEIGAPGELVSVYVPVQVTLHVPLVRNVMPANPVTVGAYTTMRRQ